MSPDNIQQDNAMITESDPFMNSQGPIVYMSSNRLPAIEDVNQVLLYILFSTLFVSLIVIAPGMRKNKMTTLTSLTTAILLGASILLSLNGTSWHVGEIDINAPYSALTMSKVSGRVGVKIGLSSVNVTLVGHLMAPKNVDGSGIINFNERFTWNQPDQMDLEYRQALRRGLPYPILTIAEYLSQDSDGFNWGRQYRLAGYYTTIMLWFSLVSWIIMLFMMCEIPRYFPYLMNLTALLMLSAVTLYSYLIPSSMTRNSNLVAITFENVALRCNFGANFWLTTIVATLALTVSSITIIYQMASREKPSVYDKSSQTGSSNSSTLTLVEETPQTSEKKSQMAHVVIPMN